MKRPSGGQPADVEVREAGRITRRKHRKDTSGFLWGTGLMLFLAAAIGHDALQGLRSGKWVDLGAKQNSFWVPWWIAAAVSLALLLCSLWCFGEYLKLKKTAPRYEPGDDDPE